MHKTKFSVLDTAPVWSGSTATRALRNTLDLAPRVDRLGYHRYWISEHHNSHRLATSSPAVLIGHVAALTSSLRVGSGGVLLTNHSPLTIAEQFGTLEALHPGRIDLGLGRSAGTDPVTTALLRGSPPDGEDFGPKLEELTSYFAGRSFANRDNPVMAVPAMENRPPIWLLGSSPSSAVSAGRLGLPYAYGHQLRPSESVAALKAYRDNFQPSVHLDRPYSILAAFVIAGESDEHAQWLAGAVQLGFLHVHQTGRTTIYPSAQEAERYRYTPEERELVRGLFAPQVIGGPDTVRRRVGELVAETGADELMAVTMVPDPADRIRSYELLAEVVGLASPVRSA
ncbi:LLM class flavin-dependent oxidoreductase [Lentzea kentuckyensis]|uniref:LLM class flavin-dependent oxidoreductase n=1 Tax=Lentzea kentuckyensis TaxID=360086 RepID=UPI000A377910|nr:LLM class flavin-dependent oxidoreductase [Lentzea kentuckyensis]